jgi:hypothetical protein
VYHQAYNDSREKTGYAHERTIRFIHFFSSGYLILTYVRPVHYFGLV